MLFTVPAGYGKTDTNLCKLICDLWQDMFMYQLYYVCLVQDEILCGKACILITPTSNMHFSAAVIATFVKTCVVIVLSILCKRTL